MINLDDLNKYNKQCSESGIVPHQTDAQDCSLPDIISSGSIEASNGIAKATATKQSGNWYRWCTFIKHSVIADESLGDIPQEQTETLLSSFAASVQQNQFGTTRKRILQIWDTTRDSIPQKLDIKKKQQQQKQQQQQQQQQQQSPHT